MDRQQLTNNLAGFIRKCNLLGYQIDDVCVYYIAGNSYDVQLLAPWVTDDNYSASMNKLFEIFWDTTDQDTKKSVLTLCLVNNKGQMHGKSVGGYAMA